MMTLITKRKTRLVIILASVLTVNSCAALQPPSATGPRGTGALYPILLTEDTQRRDATVAALNRLGHFSGNSGATEAQLQPITGTILSLSASASNVLYLPKLGATAVMNEEETRESLRRFIKEWQELIGADPAKLSLVEIIDQPDGSKLANYEQRPFRYPMRGNYGKLQIHFATDRRVLNLTSSCIPDAERIQTSLPAFSGVRLRSREAIEKLRENGVTYTDAQGNKVSFKLPATSETTARGLVIYVLASKSRPESLEFHLAWENELTNAPVQTAYVDAISGDVIAAQ